MIEVKKHYDFIPKFTFFNYYNLEDYEFEHYAELKQWLIDDEDRRKWQSEKLVNNLSEKCSLILCDRLEDIDNWENMLFEYSHSYSIIKITWETKIEDDKEQLDEALKQDKPIIIIWSIQKCATWFDYVIIDTVFLFSSIKFEATVIQSIGRALRKAPWKTWAKIYVWNDAILKKQRQQKQKAIHDEYGVNIRDIEVIDINKQRKKKSQVVMEF